MSTEDLLVLIALIVFFTAIFDVIDLQPQVGSVRFVASFTYAFYLLFRVVLQTLAGLVLNETIDPSPQVALLALISTLGGVTVLQNFTLNISGTEIANFSALGERYKARMITEESDRYALGQRTRSLVLQSEISKLSSEYLKRELRRMYLSVEYTPEDTTKRIGELEQAAETDYDLRTMLAARIATINPEYASQILAMSTPADLAGASDDDPMEHHMDHHETS